MSDLTKREAAEAAVSTDLIDRQKAIDALIDALAWTWSGTWSEKAAIDAIKDLPSVDAVKVVRCRDCKWWNDYYRECESPNWNTGTDEYIVQPAGMFCGWGERRITEDPSHPCADSVMMGD